MSTIDFIWRTADGSLSALKTIDGEIVEVIGRFMQDVPGYEHRQFLLTSENYGLYFARADTTITRVPLASRVIIYDPNSSVLNQVSQTELASAHIGEKIYLVKGAEIILPNGNKLECT